MKKITYATIMAQIAALSKQAEMLVQGDVTSKSERVVHTRRKPEAKFLDSVSGNAWTGRGKTPLWLKAALAAGKAKEDFAVAMADEVVQTSAVVADMAQERATNTRRKPTAKFVDASSGKVWTGRGKTPVWLREALNAGKTKEQFAVAA